MLRTIEKGSGPGVLLIHGAGPDASTWAGVMDALMSDRRVVAYNRRGYPGSGEAAADWGVHIDDAIGLIESLNLAPATVVGASAGCIVAAGVAARRPELLEKVVLFDPIIRGQKHLTFGLIRTVMRVQRLRKRDPEAAVDHFFQWATSYSDGGGSAWDAMTPDEQASLKGGHAAVFADMDAGDGSKQLTREQLGKLRRVTVAIGSRSDRWFVKTAKALTKAMPDAAVVTVEGAGHAAMLDQPTRAAEIILTAG